MSATGCACLPGSADFKSKAFTRSGGGCGSLHYNVAGHPGVDGAEIGVCPRFAEGEGEFLVGIQDLRLEALITARHVMYHLVSIGPADGRSRRNRDGRRRKSEVV